MHPSINPRHPTAAMALVTPGPGPGNHTHQQSHPHHTHIHQQQQQQQQQTQQQQSHLLSSQLQQQQQHESQSSILHPRILSWQMSQSLNGYPWRMQAGNVPFFTFPSTPPSFLPANPYPYTFAPAPPFSINQIAQVPTTAVPVPSYAGIAVPQATGVDSMVRGPNGTTFPIAAIPPLTDMPSEHLHGVPPGAVAVTIAGANSVSGQPTAATVVIQQPVIQQGQEAGQVQGQDMAVIHTIGGPPAPHGHYQAPAPISAHLAPAIIAADGVQGMQPSAGSEGVAVGRYHGPIVAALPPHLVSVAAPQHNVVGVSLDYTMPTTDAPNLVHADQRRAVNHLTPSSQMHVDAREANTMGSSSLFRSREESENNLSNNSQGQTMNEHHQLLDSGVNPSREADSDSSSDNESLDLNSPSRNFVSMFYRGQSFPQFDNDSDDSSDNLEATDSMLYGHRSDFSNLSPESQISSDESISPSDSEGNSPTNPSTLHLINGNTATVVISPVSDIMRSPGEEESSVETLNSTFDSDENNLSSTPENEGGTSSDESGPLSLPVLISISDSDSLTSHTTTPTSIIDLATSPSIDSPSASSGNTSPTTLTSTGHPQSYNEITTNSSVFFPVINQVNSDIEIDASRVVPRQDSTRYLGGSTMPQQRAVRLNDSSNNSSTNHEVHIMNHSMVQMTQPAQLYAAAQGQIPPSHVIIQQQAPPPPPPPPPAPQSYSHHEHSTRSLFSNYPPHLPPGGPGGNSNSLEVATMTVPGAPPTVVPLETGAVAAAMGHSANIHVLRWQQTLTQQHPAGEGCTKCILPSLSFCYA